MSPWIAFLAGGVTLYLVQRYTGKLVPSQTGGKKSR